MTKEKPKYFAVKAMFPAENIEITNRIIWCNENSIKFFNVGIRGIKIGDVFYDEEQMKEIGTHELYDDNGTKKGEIDLITMPPINIGMGFVFHNEIDALAFKLRWI